MSDIKNLRYRLRLAGAEVSTDDPFLTVSVEGSLPFITMSDSFVDSTLIDSRTLDNPDAGVVAYTKTTDSDGNVITSDTDLLIRAVSDYDNIGMAILRDPEGYLYILNNPENYNIEVVKNYGFSAGGIKVGVRSDESNRLISLRSDKIDDSCKFDSITKPDTVEILTLFIAGIDNKFNRTHKIDGDNTSLYRQIKTINFVKLDRVAVFGDIEIPCYNLVPETLYHNRPVYVSNVKPQYVYIPLPN